jgi:peptide/nickel transport system permease protein
VPALTTSAPAIPVGVAPPRTSLWTRITRNFWVRRTTKAVFTIFVVVSLTFFLVRLMPANPIEVYINSLIEQFGLPYDQARNQAAALFAIDLDAPLFLQYLSYIRSLLHGDLGTSLLSAGTPVSRIILRFLPWTIFSVGTGLLISFTLGIVLGMIMAYRRESVADHVLSALASVLSSVPNYLIAMMLVVFLGVQWKWVDIAAMRGSMSPGMQPGFHLAFIKDVLYHASLPILTYVITTIGTWMLTMKSSTISTLGEDYVTVAKARGLPERRITTAYVGRNAALPLFTQLTIAIGFIVGGSLLIESIFVYQGIGLVLLRSITQRDYPVMQGVFLIITISVIVANLLADVLYSRLDPRIKLGKGE